MGTYPVWQYKNEVVMAKQIAPGKILSTTGG